MCKVFRPLCTGTVRILLPYESSAVRFFPAHSFAKKLVFLAFHTNLVVYPPMKPPFALLLFAVPTFTFAQVTTTPPVEPAADAKETLKPDQVESVLSQLSDVEKTAVTFRSAFLQDAVEKLKKAAGSNGAALSLLKDCDEVVNAKRKSNDKAAREAVERRAEQQKLQAEAQEEEELEKEGDMLEALRLGMEYLILTIEISETKNPSAMVPKLNNYHKLLLDAAPKLRGAAGEMLSRRLVSEQPTDYRRQRLITTGSLSLIVNALQLEPFLNAADWSYDPSDIVGHYNHVMLKLARVEFKDKLPLLWDTAISLAGNYEKERLFKGEFELWTQRTLPSLQWAKAEDMVKYGQTPVTGLADMLKIIKGNPHHPSAISWISSLRNYVAPKTETPATGS